MNRRLIALLSGPTLFLLILLIPLPEGMPAAAKTTAAITAWVAAWWIAEPVNLAVTSLLPLVLFPLCGVAPLKAISGKYGDEIIFLFIAGFFFGKTIERWNLHRRIALSMVYWLGSNPARMVLGFMVASAFISMWITNTATAVMMTPVAIAVAASTTSSDDAHHLNFQKALLLGVGYACSIGGLATLIGTPTNAIFLSYVKEKFGTQVSFWQWFLFGLPFATTLLLACWVLLIRLFPLKKNTADAHETRATVRSELALLGKITAPERRLIWLFGTVILAWITGSLLWYKWLPNSNDTVVAVTGAILLFLVPSGEEQKPLLDWDTAIRIPWGIVLLFGGGLTISKGFDDSGLAAWMGAQMHGLNTLSHVAILFTVLSVVVLLSEVASNIATASMMMNVLATLAIGIHVHPFGLLLSATLAASFGFGLPVATAPNTIVFGSGYLSTRDMAKAGFLLDLVAILLLLVFLYTLLPVVWGFRI
ncbi:MAG: SLC13/DASS family transporter [Lewinellaceae bacterium]|nr:SLC13/DASS family transporter [Lewinellaceae bacterium]